MGWGDGKGDLPQEIGGARLRDHVSVQPLGARHLARVRVRARVRVTVRVRVSVRVRVWVRAKARARAKVGSWLGVALDEHRAGGDEGAVLAARLAVDPADDAPVIEPPPAA